MSMLEQVADQESPKEDTTEARPYIRRAISMLYGSNFENTVKLFQSHQQEGFPDALAIAVLSVIDKLEQEQGEPLPMEILAQVGQEVIQALVEDLVAGGVVEDITPEQLRDGVTEILNQWKQKHPDRFDAEGMGRGMSTAADEEMMKESRQTPMTNGDTNGQLPA